jgi:beta-glucanase (GH16 family)
MIDRSSSFALVFAIAAAAAGCSGSDGEGTDLPVTDGEPSLDSATGSDAARTDTATSPDGAKPIDSATTDSATSDSATTDTKAAADTKTATDASDAATDPATRPGWTLTFRDEFDAKDGTPVDDTKWVHETGGGGWGNAEREYYTNKVENSVQRGGNLVITATKDGTAGLTCWYGACQYTSARLITKDKFTQKLGRFEAKIKIPYGQGMWPAFWMLGDDIGTTGWPGCGEIDIMENIGREPGTNHGSLHGPGYSGGSPLTGTITLPGGEKLSDKFHIYAMEWDAAEIRFYLDSDTPYETHKPSDVAGKKWVYDHPFFMLLNVAVGGGWPGDPDGTTVFPQTMLVDYVRVYQKSP